MAEPDPKSRAGWSPDHQGSLAWNENRTQERKPDKGSLPGTRLEMGRNGWRAKGDLPSVHPTEAYHA